MQDIIKSVINHEWPTLEINNISNVLKIMGSHQKLITINLSKRFIKEKESFDDIF